MAIKNLLKDVFPGLAKPPPPEPVPTVAKRYPIASWSRALTIYNEVTPYEFLSLEQQLKAKSEEINSKRLFMDLSTHQIRILTSNMALTIPHTIKEMQVLQNRILELQGKPPVKEMTEEDKIEEMRKGEREKEGLHAEAQAKDRKLSKTLLKNYRYIAIKCHPDVTKDKELHEFFEAAQEARKQGDENLMLALAEEVSHTLRFGRFRKKRLEVMTNHLKALETQAEQTAQQLENFKRQKAYQILETHATDPEHARALYVGMIDQTLAQLRAMLRTLEEEERQKKAKAKFATAGYTSSFTWKTWNT